MAVAVPVAALQPDISVEGAILAPAKSLLAIAIYDDRLRPRRPSRGLAARVADRHFES